MCQTRGKCSLEHRKILAPGWWRAAWSQWGRGGVGGVCWGLALLPQTHCFQGDGGMEH